MVNYYIELKMNKKSKNSSKTRGDQLTSQTTNRKLKKMLSTKLGKNLSKNRGGSKKKSMSRMSQEKLNVANGSNSQLSDATQASRVNNMAGSEASRIDNQKDYNRSSLFNTTT